MDKILIKNLSLNLGPKIFFSDVCLELSGGKLHTLSGKNGCGKSTFFSALRGDIPSQGTLEMEGDAFAFSDPALRKKVVYICQKFDEMIADQFNFKENLRFAYLASRPSFWKKLRPLPFLPSLLERFEIDLDKPVKLLSGGQRQILALLMALQKQPSLVLLDEPTATLDPVNARRVFEFLRALMEEVELTALVICHDHELAHSFRNGSSFELHIGEAGVRYLTSS
jgi:ABC-type multidrug transport system ATPase subunit